MITPTGIQLLDAIDGITTRIEQLRAELSIALTEERIQDAAMFLKDLQAYFDSSVWSTAIRISFREEVSRYGRVAIIERILDELKEKTKTEPSICCRCKHQVGRVWMRPATPATLNAHCPAYPKVYNFVMGAEEHPLCKDVNPDGKCKLYEEAK